MPKVRRAPASSVAKTAGCPPVGIFVTCENPASRTSRIMCSQPSFMPRFSAAIDGWRIQSWQTAERFVMMFFDLGLDGLEVGGIHGGGAPGGESTGSAGDESAASERRHAPIMGRGAQAGQAVRKSRLTPI